VQKIHGILAALSPEQRSSFNLIERDGELHLNNWFVMIAAKKN